MSANNESIITFDDFITKEECDHLVRTYNDKVVKSVVVGGHTHSSRTSSTFYMPGTDPVVKTIRTKTAKLLNIPDKNI